MTRKATKTPRHRFVTFRRFSVHLPRLRRRRGIGTIRQHSRRTARLTIISTTQCDNLPPHITFMTYFGIVCRRLSPEHGHRHPSRQGHRSLPFDIPKSVSVQCRILLIMLFTAAYSIPFIVPHELKTDGVCCSSPPLRATPDLWSSQSYCST